MVLTVPQDSEVRLKPTVRGQATTEISSDLRESRPDNPASDLRTGTHPGSPNSKDTSYSDTRMSIVVPQSVGEPLITQKREVLKAGHVSKTQFTKATVRSSWDCHLSRI